MDSAFPAISSEPINWDDAVVAVHRNARSLSVSDEPRHVAELLLSAVAAALQLDPATSAVPQALHLFRRQAEVAHPGSGGCLAPWQLHRVTHFIEANLDRPIRTKQLAAIARLSTSHFSKSFRTSTGEAPYSYILKRRLARACQLIAETDEPLARIAVDCGMADQSHLSRLFRRHLGCSPMGWRRMPRDAHDAAVAAISALPSAVSRP